MTKSTTDRRKIVFINQATGYITIDIINEFAKEFDEVGVITGEIRIQDVPLDPKVLKSKVVEKSRKSNFKRFGRWLVASTQIFFLLITKYRKFEIFYFSVPPFAYFSSIVLRRRFSILMWDVYPDALIMAGISTRHIIYRIWTRLNNSLFRRAFRIYTIGEVLKIQLSKYVNPEKIVIIPLWSGISGCEIIDKNKNPFIQEQDLIGKFIVQYSGNLGAGHNIETLLEAARLTQYEPDIVYLIIGRGTKVDKVKNSIVQNNLTNCKLLPYQPDNMIRHSLAAADLNVVLVEDIIASVSIPSKIYNLMAVGSPIISLSSQVSEISKMVNYYGNGCNFEGNDYEGLASFIIRMKNSPDELAKYKSKSLLASKEFTSANARRFLVDYLNVNE